MENRIYTINELMSLITESANEVKAKIGDGVQSSNKKENSKTYKETAKKVKNKKPRRNFIKEIFSELKKVSWPSKSQIINNTVVILVFIVIATLVLSLLDVGFQKLLSFVIK